MISTLVANQPVLIATFQFMTSVEVKQFGPGNLRLAPNREMLQNTVTTSPGGVQDGISQAVADGFKQHFWQGDLWMISDQNGPVVWVASAYEFLVHRGERSYPTTPSEVMS